MRTGLVDEATTGDHEARVVVALLRTFSRDALRVAGRYAHGSDRDTVTGRDMHAALKYCARTFFEKDDAELNRSVERELREMEEEDEESSGEEDEDEDEGASDGECGEEDEDGGAQQYRGSVSDVDLVRRVDAIVDCWHLWAPDDPVHQLIKRAIDSTPVSDDEVTDQS